MKAILRSGFLALAIMALAAPANAVPFEEGLAAHERGDFATALKFWQPLAEQGDSRAQFYLGVLYDAGEGVPQDRVEGVKWYERAAKQGNVDAQYFLGISYHFGRGVPQDYSLAHMWYNIAGASAFHKASRARDLVAEDMTPDQIAEAQRMAREWMAKHQQ